MTPHHRFRGVRPGWEAFLWVPGGVTESLGVWGFEVDAAIARNYQIAYWVQHEPYEQRNHFNKFNAIPEGENWHD
jgi:hypothetical protein